jgi:hypothetical protein
MTYLFTMVVLVAPSFDLVDQAPRHKIRPAMNKEESPFFYTILLGDNRSIYDDFNNNRHACNK